jgi:hypothetical protein
MHPMARVRERVARIRRKIFYRCAASHRCEKQHAARHQRMRPCDAGGAIVACARRFVARGTRKKMERGFFWLGTSTQNSLHFQKLLQAETPKLPSIARLLVAAKGSARVHGRAVNVHRASPHGVCDASTTMRLAGSDKSGQPVFRVVRDLYGFCLVAIGDDAEHGTEYLFLRDRHSIVDA